MSKKKLLVMVLALGTILVFGATALAVDWYVDEATGAPGNTGLTTGSPKANIEQVLAATSPASYNSATDTIYIDDGVYPPDTGAYVKIDEACTIVAKDWNADNTGNDVFVDFQGTSAAAVTAGLGIEANGVNMSSFDPDTTVGGSILFRVTDSDGDAAQDMLYGVSIDTANIGTGGAVTSVTLKDFAMVGGANNGGKPIAAALFVRAGSYGVSGVTVDNWTIDTFDDTGNADGGIYLKDDSVPALGIDVDITNCDIGKATPNHVGIKLAGAATNPNYDGTIISGNEIVMKANANAVGISLTGDKAKIQQNYIWETGHSNLATAIKMASSQNEITGNHIIDGAIGISLNSATGTNNTFSRNYVHTGGTNNVKILANGTGNVFSSNNFAGAANSFVHNGASDVVVTDCYWGTDSAVTAAGYVTKGGAGDITPFTILTKGILTEVNVDVLYVNQTALSTSGALELFGYNCFGTILTGVAGIDAGTASETHYVTVAAGTYNPQAVAKVAIQVTNDYTTLRAATGATPTIQPIRDAGGSCIWGAIHILSADNVTIDGFNVVSPVVSVGGDRGIYAQLATNFTIQNNTITSWDNTGGVEGIFAMSCTTGTIKDNTLKLNNNAIQVSGSTGITVQGNLCQNNVGDAIALATASTGITVTGNKVYSNAGGMYVTANSTGTFHQNEIVNNTGWYGFKYTGAATIDAENNWWGSSTGPTHPTNAGGTGDVVLETGLGTVDFNPWWHSAVGPTTATYSYSDGAGYYGVSVPLAPGSVAPADVYDEIPGVTLYGAYPYGSYQTNPDVDPNKGTWLYLSGNTTITEEGTTVTADQILTFATAGWYLISVPYTADWNAATFTPGKSDFYCETGTTNVALWVCVQPSAGYVVKYTGSPFVLNPWTAYWVKVLTDGATIKFTQTSAPVTPPLSVSLAPMGLHAAPTVSPPPPPALESGGISVELGMSSSGVSFIATGPVTSLKAQVFALDGGLVAEQTADGNELVWSMQSAAGEPVANGVYLVNVSAMNQAGYWIDLGLFRVLVLR